MTPTPELFDFEDLDVCEDKDLFGKAPTRYVFGGNPCLIAQRRLPNENRPEDTGSEVWPASLALARYLEHESLREDIGLVTAFLAQGKGQTRAARCHGASPRGRWLLELGAGLGLVGLAARALGARRVFLTDIALALPWLERNVDLNRRGGTCEVLELDWYSPEECSLPTKSVDLVCASDCVLWPELFEPLCDTLDHVMGDDTVALLSVVHRCDQVRDFFPILERRMQFEEVWACGARGDREAGHIRIYRVQRHGAARRGPEAARPTGDYLSTTTLERLVGVPEGSIESFALGTNGIRRGAHSITCQFSLTPSPADGPTEEEAAVPPSVLVQQPAPRQAAAASRERQGQGPRAGAEAASAQDIATYLVEVNWFDRFNEELRSRGVNLSRCRALWSEGAPALGRPAALGAEATSAETLSWAADVSSNWVSIIEDLAEPAWTQHLYLSEAQLHAALGMLADLHGATMGDDEILDDARQLLHEHGTYWAPMHRPPGELDCLETRWMDFMREFKHLDEELFARPEVQALGARLRGAQAEVDEGLRGRASQSVRGRTLLHGDMRTANIFFSTASDRSAQAVPLNFRWAGLGFSAQDVAYLLISSAELGLLASGKAIRRLISNAYLLPLRRKVGSFAAPTAAEFFRTFRLACLDYAKVVWGFHLAQKDPAWFDAAGRCLGLCAHNRNLGHALGLVRFVARLLDGTEVPGFAD